MLILTLNLGSTSSKVAVYEDDQERFSETVRHDADLLAKTKMPAEQLGFRKENIFSAIEDAGYKITDFDAVCSRAGLIRLIESGTYEEMRSLAEGALRVLKGGYEAKVYEPVL